MSGMKERRRTPRAFLAVPLDIYDPKGHMIVGEGRCVDFSILGARIASRKPLKARSAVRLHLPPISRPALEITGKVIWSRKLNREFEYGIQFSTSPQKPVP